MAADKRLADKVVLVTRPRHQQEEFIQLLHKRAAKTLSFPTIEIQAVAPGDLLLDKLRQLNKYDLIILVSANAVNYALAQLKQLDIPIESLESDIAVIGSATRNAATVAGLKVNYLPDTGFSSEDLLQLPAMQATQVESKQVLIIRGEGGLEELANRLRERGASVSYAEVYRRSIPEVDAGIKRQQLSQKWHELGVNLITVTSNDAMKNLYDMLDTPGRDNMLKTELIVPSQRCYTQAQKMGFESITIADSATNKQMIEAIIKLSNGKIED